MGLDIYVIKPCPIEEADKDQFDDFGYHNTNNPKIIKSFPQFVQEIPVECDDWAAIGHPEFETGEYWEDHSFIGSSDRFIVFEDPGRRYGSGYFDPSEELLEELKDKIVLTVATDDIPSRLTTVKIVPYKEIGYQRKGANQKFYEDGKWDDPEKCIVTTQSELDHDIQEYFSSEAPESPGGWGSFTEYTGIPDDKRKKDFMENIASHFIEGETVVAYW